MVIKSKSLMCGTVSAMCVVATLGLVVKITEPKVVKTTAVIVETKVEGTDVKPKVETKVKPKVETKVKPKGKSPWIGIRKKNPPKPKPITGKEASRLAKEAKEASRVANKASQQRRLTTS